MQWLSTAQRARIKTERARAWVRAITVETWPERDEAALDYYDEALQAPTSTVISGAYLWRTQADRRGAPGGLFDTAHLVLTTDEVYSGTLLARRTRLVVEGVTLKVTGLTPIAEFGEVVATAVRIGTEAEP